MDELASSSLGRKKQNANATCLCTSGRRAGVVVGPGWFVGPVWARETRGGSDFSSFWRDV